MLNTTPNVLNHPLALLFQWNLVTSNPKVNNQSTTQKRMLYATIARKRDITRVNAMLYNARTTPTTLQLPTSNVVPTTTHPTNVTYTFSPRSMR
jgi:hypothetical protein